MNLYDDLDTKQIADWSSGLKLIQPQLKLQAKPPIKKPNVLTPVINLKANKNVEPQKPKIKPQMIITSSPVTITTTLQIAEKSYFDDWEGNEYDPSVPNEYEKIIKERREKDKERRDSRKDDRKRHKNDKDAKFSGFGGRPMSDEDEEYNRAAANNRGLGGAMIAPPPSLQENLGSSSSDRSSSGTINTYGGSSVAAKIMAKYGFKDGQGLGKQEQGMSIALQVEKTSKRGGRIIHEKELALGSESPPYEGPGVSPAMMPPPPIPVAAPIQTPEPTITEIMKQPSKVVLLRNMVSPGDVDEELEPEVKDECNTKYGDVISVVIKELPNKVPEESVRIFVCFKRIESAIKAVVDLNGRFFGGKQVRAGFYSQDKFENLILYN